MDCYSVHVVFVKLSNDTMGNDFRILSNKILGCRWSPTCVGMCERGEYYSQNLNIVLLLGVKDKMIVRIVFLFSVVIIDKNHTEPIKVIRNSCTHY